MRELRQLAERDAIHPIDAEFGIMLGRKASGRLGNGRDVALLAMTGALLSRDRQGGHSCVALEAYSGRAWPVEEANPFPSADEWRKVLAASGLCGDGSTLTPLVLEGDRLYLRRLHAAECRLAASILSRVQGASAGMPQECEQVFTSLFPEFAHGAEDLQASAAKASLESRLTVITGGPGTGKTTTVARILALLLVRDPQASIALAAPTGKAAARLAEAIGLTLDGLPLDSAIAARIPREGRTLHKLLGYQPWSECFRQNADEPLAHSVIVVDEASMVDVLMMDALFAAACPDATIILLGDPDQLASVETGFVLGDICRAADHAGSALHGRVVRLRRSYRFEKHPGIGAVAEAVRAGDDDRALAALRDPRLQDVTLRESINGVDQLLETMVPSIEAYLASASPEEALAKLGAFRVLCAHREGHLGVSGINSAIERWIARRGVPTRAEWYPFRPVLITANDPSTQLFNGDLGVAWVGQGSTKVCFADGAGGIRRISPARLPAHETAWATTVHKAQGSEADKVLLVLPEKDGLLLTRELLYTGVTRARRRVEIVGGEGVFRSAIGRVTRRSSGLEDRLSG